MTPTPPPDAAPPLPATFACPNCGAVNDARNALCGRCSFAVHAAAAAATPPPNVTPPATGAEPLSGLIPYKNQSALIAYYLAVFSAIPCLGIVLGIAALVLGLKGLRYAKEHPEARGTAHAWVGIVVGGLFAFGYLALTIVFFASTRFGR